MPTANANNPTRREGAQASTGDEAVHLLCGETIAPPKPRARWPRDSESYVDARVNPDQRTGSTPERPQETRRNGGGHPRNPSTQQTQPTKHLWAGGGETT